MCLSPIPVWFVCKSCGDSFMLMTRFVEHKKDKHFSEFQNIKFIVFEETTRDQNENQDPTTQESESSTVKEKLAFIESIPVPLPKLRLVKRNSDLFHTHTVDKAPEPELNYLPSTYNLSSPSHGEDDFIGGSPVTPPSSTPPFLPDSQQQHEQDVHIIKTEGVLENNNETEKNNMTNNDLFHGGEFLQHVNVDLATAQIPDSNTAMAITEIDSDAVFDFQGGLIFQKSTFATNKNSLGNSEENYDEVIIPYSIPSSLISSVISVGDDENDDDDDNDPHLDPTLQPITQLIIYTSENLDTEANPLQENSHNANPKNVPLKVKKLANSKTITKPKVQKASNDKAKATNKPAHNNNNPFVLLTRLTSQEIQITSRIQNVKRKRNRNRPKKLPSKRSTSKLNPQLYGCKFCSKKYKRQPRLKIHTKICKSRNRKNSSKAKQKSQAKPPRQRKQSWSSALKAKVAKANQPKPKNYSSAPKQLLVASKIVHHLVGANVVQIQKNYVCSICQLVCSRISTLRNHYATHSDLKPFSCTQPNCEKAFKTRKNLYQHENLAHSHTKIFICDQEGCSKSFPARNLLIRHKSSEHANTSRIRINKKRCLDNTQCRTETELSSSSKKKSFPLHKRPPAPAPAPAPGYPRGQVPESFKCHICNKEFPWKAYLRNHLKLIHSTSQKNKHSKSQGDGPGPTTLTLTTGKRKRKAVVPFDV